jgi:hypothetical protein
MCFGGSKETELFLWNHAFNIRLSSESLFPHFFLLKPVQQDMQQCLTDFLENNLESPFVLESHIDT